MNAAFVALLAAAAQQSPYDSVFEQLKSIAPLRDSVAAVRNVVLRRDAMELRLESGTAFLLTPLSGRTIGIAFVGSGRLTFEPPLMVEQYNLRRVFGDSSVSGPITAAVFVFADSTARELKRRLTFGSGDAARVGDAGGAVGDALDYIVDGGSRSAFPTLMTSLLNGTTTGYFSAYIKRARGESVMFEYDPLQPEEVSLYRRGKMVGQRFETVCQFQRAPDLMANVSVAAEQTEPLQLASYEIDARIDGNYKFSAIATQRLVGRPGRDPQHWARFVLYSELDVDSISTDKGPPTSFFRRNNEPELWVRFPRAVGPGDSITLKVAYHGGLIGFGSAIEDFLPSIWNPRRREMFPVLDSWAYIKSTAFWYPRYTTEQSSPFTLTFHTPRKLKFATIGRMVDSSTSGDIFTTKWMSEAPTNHVSFNIGKFEQLEIRDPRIPPVTVHVNTEAHNTIARLILSARHPEEFVGADVANSLSFFTSVFGKPLFSQYYATEIPYWHGQAFPGMIHLSWVTFLGISTDGDDEMFRAHEMAHQWWGIGVEPAGYRDAWISEGFAEFAGMWYMQMVLNDNEKYLKALRRSRDDIRRERNKVAPIGLGYRSAESWRGGYSLMTYRKGAWVLHMLRNMMLNTRNMDESKFKAMMRDFYETYRGKRASTLDFQRTVETHFGQPMDWFFNEWVYGTSVPTYTFSWKAETDSAGKPAVRLRVRQSDVPPGFVMYVPVLIQFAGGGEAMIRVLVRDEGAEATVRLPEVPQKVLLNPLESVLAEVKTEAWSDR
ncbi:MAG TPA: M1 family aminopeptidase [Gemmatimonadales bacterium]|nr:M1 family aminopeptidase [Gemmatimonadales bacterium]